MVMRPTKLPCLVQEENGRRKGKEIENVEGRREKGANEKKETDTFKINAFFIAITFIFTILSQRNGP